MRNFQSFYSFLSFIRVSATLISAGLLLQGCLDNGSGSESDTNVVGVPGAVSDPLTTPDQTICNPLNNPSGSKANNGVIANMVWLDSTMPPVNGQPALPSVSDYFSIGNVVQSTIYFDRLFIPTRPFDKGFVTQAGDTVLNANGQPMYEYFAMHMETQLQIGLDDPEGDYQMLVLADDGAVLKVADGADPTSYRMLVDDDGTHPTQMACSNITTTTPLHMTHGAKVPMIVDYYQGPRYHIALVVMWRPVPDGTDPDVPVSDPLCGKSGNNFFFDPDNDSAPTTNYANLEARGWRVLQNSNYVFPKPATNPCVTPVDTLTVTEPTITTPSRTSVQVVWDTSIPSTSQVQYQNITTGAVYVTPQDGTLVTHHIVTISSNLTNNTVYGFTVISTSPDGQSVSGDQKFQRTSK